METGRYKIMISLRYLESVLMSATTGYSNADFNMNGQVQNNDNENYWKS